MEIRIYELDMKNLVFVPREIIINPSSVVYKEHAHKSGYFIIKIPLADPKAKELRKHRFVIIDKHFSGIIRDIYKSTAYGQNEMTVTGTDLKGLLEQRTVVPQGAFDGGYEAAIGFDEIAGDTETCVKHYWNANIGEYADGMRKIPFLHVGENLHRGKPDDSYRSRFGNLGEVTATLAENCGLVVTAGIDMADLDNEIYRFIFDVREPADRTAIRETDPEDTVKEPVVLSLDRNTVLSMDFADETSGSGNAFYTARSGGKYEDDVRTTIFYPEDTPEPSGIYRYEKNLNVSIPRDAADEREDLESQARHGMAGFIPRSSIAAKVNFANLVRGRDYELGDYVTVQNLEWGVEEDKQITQIETNAAAGQRNITVTLGSAKRTLNEKIRRDIDNI